MTQYSGFLVQGAWLVEEPMAWRGRSTIGVTEFMQELARWPAGDLEVVALAGGVLAVDFSNHAQAFADTTKEAAVLDHALTAMAERVRLLATLAVATHSAMVNRHNYAVRTVDVSHEELFHFGPQIDGNHFSYDPTKSSLGIVPGQGFLIRWHGTAVYDADVLRDAANMLGVLTKHSDPKAVEYMALLNKSLAAHGRQDFSTAVALAWTVAEAVLDRRWRSFLSESVASSGIPISSSRRRTLTGPNFTASIRSEAMALAGALDGDMYERLARARKLRNDWLHSLKPISYRDSEDTISTAAHFLASELSVSLPIVALSGTTVLTKLWPPQE